MWKDWAVNLSNDSCFNSFPRKVSIRLVGKEYLILKDGNNHDITGNANNRSYY